MGLTFAQQADALRYKAAQCEMLLRKRPNKLTWMIYRAANRGRNKKASIHAGAYESCLAFLDSVLFDGKGRLPFT